MIVLRHVKKNKNYCQHSLYSFWPQPAISAWTECSKLFSLISVSIGRQIGLMKSETMFAYTNTSKFIKNITLFRLKKEKKKYILLFYIHLKPQNRRKFTSNKIVYYIWYSSIVYYSQSLLLFIYIYRNPKNIPRYLQVLLKCFLCLRYKTQHTTESYILG